MKRSNGSGSRRGPGPSGGREIVGMRTNSRNRAIALSSCRVSGDSVEVMRPIVALLGLVTAMLVGVAAPLGAIVTAGLLSRQPLSAAGAEVNDHLTGLDQYIRLAEADRMRVLQSPQGALREPIDPNDRGARPFTVGAFAAGVGSVSSTLSSS